jgi:glutamine phosphoribosylpyrophosphate amidotransferase
VDTPRRSELIAATHTVEEIQRYLNADSLAYLSLGGLTSAVAPSQRSYCTSCYTGHYPVEFPRDTESYLQLALKLDKSDSRNGEKLDIADKLDLADKVPSGAL